MSHDKFPPRPPRKTRPGAPLRPLLSGLAAAGALIILFLAGAAAENFGHRDQAAATTSPKPEPRAALPRLGKAVRDGRFEFVVRHVDCARTTVGVEHLKSTADGKYCVVTLSIRNIAGEPQIFLGKVQKAYDAAGTSYTEDAIASLYANQNTRTLLRKIDPGDSVTGKMVFDVPKATTLTTLELHDSYLSGGVEVALS
jgi:hypothetical protein